MPRSRRWIPDDSAVHIMNRGNNRQNIFHNDSDKLYYYHLLDELRIENEIIIFHYCLMDNHVHLIIRASCAERVSKFMKQLNLSYYNYYKKLYRYCGHIWQGRFKSNVIESDNYLLHCGKYIELNPVRAGVVNHPAEYAFSSFQYYSLGRKDRLISDNPALLLLADNPRKRREGNVK